MVVYYGFQGQDMALECHEQLICLFYDVYVLDWGMTILLPKCLHSSTQHPRHLWGYCGNKGAIATVTEVTKKTTLPWRHSRVYSEASEQKRAPSLTISALLFPPRVTRAVKETLIVYYLETSLGLFNMMSNTLHFTPRGYLRNDSIAFGLDFYAQ